MKPIGALVILVLCGFIGYQFAYQPIVDAMGLEKPKPPEEHWENPAPVVVEMAPEAKPAYEEVKPTVVSVAMSPTEPAPSMTPTPPEAAPSNMTSSHPSPNGDGFVPPTFPPIQDVVKNWMEIPKSAFQNPIRLIKPVEFVTVINGNKFGSKVPAGAQAYVVLQQGTVLTVAPTPTSPAKAQVTLDDTNLKEVLTTAYERWKVNMTEYKRRQHLFAKEAAGRAKDAGSSGGAISNETPKRNAEGSYDLLLASMKAGQVTEITPANVKKWGDVAMEKIDGKDYFTILVDYTTKTMFGDFDTQAQARITGGKVEKWIYTGSGEVVP